MKGNCRPTIAPSFTAGRSVTCPSTVIGAPSAPNATGAVLKISVKVSASSGGSPTRISSALVIATGVPNPAMPSSRQPKQKPITTSTTRRSFGRCVEHPVAKRVETPGYDRDVVEQQRVEHDPHHRPKREHAAGRDAVEREPGGKLPHRHGDQKSRDEARQRGLPGRTAQHAQRDQHGRDRQGRHQKRQEQAVAHRRQKLVEHSYSPRQCNLSVCANWQFPALADFCPRGR